MKSSSLGVAVRRREFITSLASTITAWPFVGFAQTASKVYRIGILSTNPLPAETSVGAAILRAFAKHGYMPGRNVALEMRAGGNHSERLPQLAKDLVASKVDLILTFSFPAVLAAKNATTTIPIVTTEAGGDPVSLGLVKSLSHPGGNITGVSDMAIELAPKRLQLLKDMVPTMRTVAVLYNKNDRGMTLRYQGVVAAAQTMRVRVQALGVAEPDDFDEAFRYGARLTGRNSHGLGYTHLPQSPTGLRIRCRTSAAGRLRAGELCKGWRFVGLQPRP